MSSTTSSEKSLGTEDSFLPDNSKYTVSADPEPPPGLNDNTTTKNTKTIPWRTLFTFTSKKHIFVLVMAIVFSILSALVPPGTAIVFGDIFQELASLGHPGSKPDELLGKVAPLILVLFQLACFSWILNGLFFGIWVSFGVLQAKYARERLFETCLSRRNGWTEGGKIEEESVLTPRYQTQIDEFQMATSQPLGFVVQAIASALISFGVALYYSWRLTLVIVAGLPISFAILNTISYFMSSRVQKHEEHMSLASRIVNQAISAIETVKLFNGQDHERKQYDITLQKAANEFNEQAKLNAAQIGLVRFVTLAMFVQGFWYGSKLVRSSDNEDTVGDVMTTFWSCLTAAQSFEMILPQLIFLEKGKAAAANLRSMISNGDTESDHPDILSGTLQPEKCNGAISINKVNFSYPSSAGVRSLSDLTLSIDAGGTVFITGQSGSGKSTVGNLLLRLWEHQSGTVTIDGVNLEDIDIEWLRRNVMVIQQGSPLFNESFSLNISIGSPEFETVTKQDIKNSCRDSQLSETLSNLPNYLNTIVGFGGNQLSGGQRQRVGIARARIRDSPILILDESTNGLDEATKELVMEDIRKWRQGKTTIIITHDLSQIRASDFVYVLDAGRVVQAGIKEKLEQDYMGPFEKLRRSSMVVDNNDYMLAPDEDSTPAIAYDVEASEGMSGISMDQVRALQQSYTMQNGHDFEESEPTIYDIDMSPTQTGIPAESLAQFQLFNDQQVNFAPQRGEPIVYEIEATPLEYGIPPQTLYLARGIDNTNNENPQLKPVVSPIPETAVIENEMMKTDTTITCTPVEDDDFRQTTPVDMGLKRQRDCDKQSTAMNKPQPLSFIRAFTSVLEALNPKQRLLLGLGFFAAFVNALSTPMFSYCLSKVLLTFFNPGNNGTEVTQWSLVVLAVAVVDAASIFSMQYLLEYTGQIWIDRLRNSGFTNILFQERYWFNDEKNKVSNINTDLDNHAEEMRNLLGRFAGYAFIGIVMIVASVIWSFAECWKLTLVGLSAAPVLFLIARLFATVSSKWEDKCNGRNLALSAIFHETMSNIYTIRALLLERHFRKKFKNASRKAFRCGVKRSIASGFAFGIADSSILFATALVFYYGTYLVAHGSYPIESIMSVFALLLFCFANANVIFGMIPQISNSKESARRVLRLANLDTPPHLQFNKEKHVELDGSIRFSNVTFSYPTSPAVNALSSISLTVNPGEVIALVGPSGSGKSTVSLLLQRLYHPNSGAIYFNGGISTSEIPIKTLHSQISSVPQSPTLFSATIRQNIIYSIPFDKFPSQSQIEEAAVKAGIHEWIASLPNGYDTYLPNGHQSVSGGQAQRIAIARALVRKPKILILDEATSALDNESARVVMNTIRGLRKRDNGTEWRVLGRKIYEEKEKTTVILITHKPEIMAISDRVVRIEKGKVVDDGRNSGRKFSLNRWDYGHSGVGNSWNGSGFGGC